jgi:hypothetical protein
MVRSYLIENRICYQGDGNGGGGGGGNNDSSSGGGDASFRDNERPGLVSQDRPVGGTTNVRQASPPPERDSDPDPIVDIVTMGRNIEPVRVDQTTERAFQDFARTDPVLNPGFGLPRLPSAGSGDAQAAANVEALVQAAVQPAPPPPPPAALPPERLESAIPPPADNSQAELARQLINQAAQESLANPDRPAPRNRVDRAPGRNDPMSGFFADAYDQLYGTPDPNDAPVTAPGTGIGSILSGGILGGLTNQPDPADAAAFNVGQLMSLPGAVRDPQTGLVSGAQAGPGILSMNPFGGVVYSGVNDPNYEGAFQDLVRGTAGQNEVQSGDESQQMMQASAPPPAVDPGTTTPEQIDDLAINYLRNPFFLYSGAGNLFQPYGYAPNTLVDLLQTRNMTMPDQAAPNLNLFGNPTDFT